MAGIKFVNSQGTKIWVVDKPATAWADCDASVKAITAGKQVLCPQSLGDISETRTETKYKCLSSDNSLTIAGGIERGSLEIGMFFDAKDADGQKALDDAFKANKQIVIGIELADKPDATQGATAKAGNGTLLWFAGTITGKTLAITMDSAVMYNLTISISSEITQCPAVGDVTKTP